MISANRSLIQKVSLLGVYGLFTCQGFAQAPLIVEDFVDEFSVPDYWSGTWGTFPLLEWTDEDSAGSPNSGSMKLTGDYFTSADDGWEQMVVTRSFDAPVVGSDFSKISIDVKAHPDSVANLDGNYGYFELKRPDGSTFGGTNITSTEWTQITFDLAATEGEITGIIIQNGSGSFQGNVILQLDKLSFIPRSNEQGTAPALEMQSAKGTTGLRLTASAFGQAYQRQNVVYVPSEDWFNGIYWENQDGPMNYSITWADFPSGADHPGFQGHIMLTVDGAGGTSPDWSDPNVIMIEFQYANAPGPDGLPDTEDDVLQARARFLHKIYEPQGNAMLYRTDPANGPVGILGEVFSNDMNGKWSLIFNDLENVDILTPEGNSVSIQLPQESAEVFDGSLSLFGISALFGIQPNSETNVGQSAAISNLSITKGPNVLVDESFTELELNPDNWLVRAQDASGIYPIPSDLAYTLSWALPDAGYVLSIAPQLDGARTIFESTRLVGSRRTALIQWSDLPDGSQGFFILHPNSN